MSLIGDQVKQLREYSKELESSCSPNESYMVKQAADTIEELSTKLHASQMERSLQYYNDGWIPCEDRLPECQKGAETDALMYQIKGKETIHVGYYGTGGKYRDKYFRNYWDTKEGVDAKDVIAWRPMPAPYKEKERD